MTARELLLATFYGTLAYAIIALKDGTEAVARFAATGEEHDGEGVAVTLYEGGTYVVGEDYAIKVLEQVGYCPTKGCGNEAGNLGHCFQCRHEPFGIEWQIEQQERAFAY